MAWNRTTQMGSAALALCVALSCCRSSQETAPDTPRSAGGAPAAQPDAASTSSSPAPPTQEQVIALIPGSELPLEVTPPSTLSAHYARARQGATEPPPVSCEQTSPGHWSCSVSVSPDEFLYSLGVVRDGERFRLESAEVLADD